MSETEIGSTRCLDCRKQYGEFPPGCVCTECGGQVATLMSRVHVAPPQPKPSKWGGWRKLVDRMTRRGGAS